MNKKGLSEQDIRTKFITPAIINAGWDGMKQLREEYRITAGRIYVKGNLTKRGKARVADYILFYKPNIPIAVVEAKDNNHPVGAGIQQALQYAQMLDIPFVYSSNGDGFLEHDTTAENGPVERELPLDAFPSPQQLWKRYLDYKGFSKETESIISQDFYFDKEKPLRYYQQVAVNRTIEAVAEGQNRLLLVMATGSGKTLTAFHIIWRLWKSGTKKRVLFLADRNNLINQTKVNDFKPFERVITKISSRKVDKSFEVYLALYQALTGPEPEKQIYKKFSPNFFDLIVVDECHRGSAKEDSEWRDILDYFSSASQIGMTATPKETKYISNINYFGKPVYMYSLRQGIQDGFLAPYKVIRITMNTDDYWRPSAGDVDRYNRLVPDKIYNLRDYDRNLVLDERTKTIARRVTEFLKKTDRYAKTIIFCEDIEHAGRMRQALINENADLAANNYKYIMRITSEDTNDGLLELDNFKNPNETYPVIVTTSKLLSTGADVKTCKLIVIDKNINSLTEFKQIIGRGSRVMEDYYKMYFTIIDFRRATNLFADPNFDGEPVMIFEAKPEGPTIPDEEPVDEIHWPEEDSGDSESPPSVPTDYVPNSFGSGGIHSDPPDFGPKKYYVDGVSVEIINERVQYIGSDGNLITESLRDYCRRSIRRQYASLDLFLKQWSKTRQKQAIKDELLEHGVFLEELQDEVGKDLDTFDLICHVAFDQKPLTRRERAGKIKKHDYFVKYGEKARSVLEALLDKYSHQGIEDIEDLGILNVYPFNRFGSPVEIIRSFGGKKKYLEALQELTDQLYTAA